MTTAQVSSILPRHAPEKNRFWYESPAIRASRKVYMKLSLTFGNSPVRQFITSEIEAFAISEWSSS
jgi:hypothetical protein